MILEKVCCGNCNYKMAMFNNDPEGPHISVNEKELYVYFFAGMIIIVCKCCHSHNVIVSKEYEEAHPVEVKKALEIKGSKRAVFSEWVSRKNYEQS